MQLSLEQLNADALAHRKIRALETLHMMVACQGDTKSWDSLQGELRRTLRQ
jgi:hypothetical protein